MKQLTAEQMDHVLRRLAKLKPCPMCGARDYRASEHFAAVPSFTLTPEDTIIMTPVVAVGCGSCGFMASFSVHVLGVSPLPAGTTRN